MGRDIKNGDPLITCKANFSYTEVTLKTVKFRASVNLNGQMEDTISATLLTPRCTVMAN